MFKTQVGSLQSFEHFMASFLWSVRVQTMEKCGQFGFFYNNKDNYEQTRLS